MASTDADAPQGFDLPIRRGDGLSQEGRTSIENALQKYRERVLELNMAALEIVIQALEQRDFRPIEFWPKKPDLSPDELPKRRIEKLEENHGIRLDPADASISSVRDFLSEDRRENLIKTCRLDGINHKKVDQEARNAWIENTETKISTAERVEDRPDGLPVDLKYLMTLVRGLCGPGLPSYRFSGKLHQLEFLSDIDGDEEEDEEPTGSGCVTVPRIQEDFGRGELSDIQGEWDNCVVALAVGIGNGGFAVYCREEDVCDGSSKAGAGDMA